MGQSERDVGFLRELFLLYGTVSDPEKSYHLELKFQSEDEAAAAKEALERLGIDSGCTDRRGRKVIYIKDGDQISAFLALIGAHTALFEFENTRAMREMREGIQRRVNCETANISKTVSASVRQIDDIRYIDETVGLDRLPKPLRDIASLREKHPEATFSELAGLCPDLSKSGVNHRLRKISGIARSLRNGGFHEDDL